MLRKSMDSTYYNVLINNFTYGLRWYRCPMKRMWVLYNILEDFLVVDGKAV